MMRNLKAPLVGRPHCKQPLRITNWQAAHFCRVVGCGLESRYIIEIDQVSDFMIATTSKINAHQLSDACAWRLAQHRNSIHTHARHCGTHLCCRAEQATGAKSVRSDSAPAWSRPNAYCNPTVYINVKPTVTSRRESCTTCTFQTTPVHEQSRALGTHKVTYRLENCEFK